MCRFEIHLFLSTHASHCVITVAWHIFIRVDAANEVAYELIDEPIQEPQAGEQQEDAVEPTAEEVSNPSDLQGKPWSITFTFKYSMLSMYLNIYVYRNCMKP